MSEEYTVNTGRLDLSPRVIYDRISRTVIGQEDAKRTVAISLFMHFVRYYQHEKVGGSIPKKSNVLLMGPTGCGKTFVVHEGCRAIQELTGYPICPMLEVDCTELSSRGWEGDNLSDKIIAHHANYGSNVAAFNTSVVFLDEFDKLCKPAKGSAGTDHNKMTQYNMLKMIEGTNIESKQFSGKISTHQMLFIMAGNFSEVRHNRKTRKRNMGFGKSHEDELITDPHLELERAGMATQLVGRTPYIAELAGLNEEQLMIILDEHLIPDLGITWKFLKRELFVPDYKKEEIVSKCFKRKTGARGLHADLCRHIEDDLFDMELKL